MYSVLELVSITSDFSVTTGRIAKFVLEISSKSNGIPLHIKYAYIVSSFTLRIPKPPKEEDETPPKPQPTDVAEKISHKGVLREVFKRIFDDAKAVRWTGIATMELLLNDFQDSLALAILSGSLQQCEKKVDIEATLSTRNGSDISCSFQGVPNDVQQFRQLLWPQWQTAAEKEATVRVSLAFLGDGLALDDAGIAAFTKVFAGLGSQTAYVAATQRS